MYQQICTTKAILIFPIAELDLVDHLVKHSRVFGKDLLDPTDKYVNSLKRDFWEKKQMPIPYSEVHLELSNNFTYCTINIFDKYIGASRWTNSIRL